MPIKKNEIEKFIFNPENPKQCKSYGLLVTIAKKDNYSYFSPDFLKYFFGEQILNDDFKSELWDIPNNYNKLDFNKKIKLYKEQLSPSDLDEFVKNIDINRINNQRIDQYSLVKKLISYYQTLSSSINIKEINKKDFRLYVIDNILKNDNDLIDI